MTVVRRFLLPESDGSGSYMVVVPWGAETLSCSVVGLNIAIYALVDPDIETCEGRMFEVVGTDGALYATDDQGADVEFRYVGTVVVQGLEHHVFEWLSLPEGAPWWQVENGKNGIK